MADVNVGVITRWDKLLGETFPYIEEWGSPYSEDYVRLIGERKMTVPAMFQDKVVTQEGAKPPFNGAWFASPPKYPFGRIDTAYFIPAGVQVVENHVAYIVIMVEGDPSDIPPGFEDMGRDDPIEPDTKWPEIVAGLLQLTDDAEQEAAVTNLLNDFWADTQGLGTPRELTLLLRRFTS